MQRRTRGKESSEDEYQPPKVKPKNFVGDDEDDDDDDDNEVKEEPKKKNRVLHSSSEGRLTYFFHLSREDTLKMKNQLKLN